MCGILGGFWREHLPNIEDVFPEVLCTLDHRGPDDRGSWFQRTENKTIALGQTRLSIIDLSERGHQPMRSGDGRLTMVFNGEIFNYRELRAELESLGHQFHTDSDTEVLLVAWSVWGESCLVRLIGMFAFAVHDAEADTLTCVRDAFGIKPLFIAYDDKKFLLASEMHSILELRGETKCLNSQRAYDYLLFGVHDTGTETFVKGVSHLPPAHLVRLDLAVAGKPEMVRWWKPTITPGPQLTFSEARDQLRELFLDTVRLHMRSDVPVGAALSGGIDSSALVCAMRYIEPELPIHTFSFIAADVDLSEERWIDIVNAHVGATVHKVHVKADDLARDLPDLIRTQGEPFGSTNMYAQYRVFQAAREQGIKVVLEGQGADELLGGYDGYGGQRMRTLLETGGFSELIHFANQWPRWPGRFGKSAWRALIGQLLPDFLFNRGLRFAGIDVAPSWVSRGRLAEFEVTEQPRRARGSREGFRRRLAEVLSLALSTGGLPTLLRYGDRNAMRFSVENRVPFLTVPLADFLLRLPEEFLVSRDGETKSVFRAAMRGIVPDEILDRKDKVGFDTPMQQWIGPFVERIRDGFNYMQKIGFLDSDEMLKEFDRALAGVRPMDNQIWRMVNLSWWSRLNEVQ